MSSKVRRHPGRRPNVHPLPDVPLIGSGAAFRKGDEFARVSIGDKYTAILRVNGPRAGTMTLVKTAHFTRPTSPWQRTRGNAIAVREAGR